MRSQVLPRELENISLENTPQYDSCEDEMQNEQIFPYLADELDPMPEVGDHYIGVERGDNVARGHVVAWSHDTSRNIIGKALMNPILDTRM